LDISKHFAAHQRFPFVPLGAEGNEAMTHLKLTTRQPIESDLPAVLDMIHALAAHHGDTSTLTLEGLSQEARGWHCIIVACAGPDVVGYAALLQMGQLQFGVRGTDMHHLFVVTAHRGRGVGRALIDASIAVSKQLNCKYLTVGTHPDNAAAAKVYLTAGFDPLPDSGPRFRIRL
jgi:ribosomal protein S18 acetylase RimI-like enzyme